MGMNVPARRLGFSLGMFIISIEEVNVDEINSFVGASDDNTKRTRFRVVALGDAVRDRDDMDEDMLEEALDDNTKMLDDDFFDLIK